MLERGITGLLLVIAVIHLLERLLDALAETVMVTILISAEQHQRKDDDFAAGSELLAVNVLLSKLLNVGWKLFRHSVRIMPEQRPFVTQNPDSLVMKNPAFANARLA